MAKDISDKLTETFLGYPFGDFSCRAVIFDCDGTLAKTGDLHYQAFAAALEDQNASLPRSWYVQQTGLDRDGLLRAYIDEFGGAYDHALLVQASIENYLKIAHQAKPIELVVAFARAMHGCVPLAVGSNAERVIVKSTLTALGIETLFDAIVAVDDVEKPKPAPDIYLQAAGKLGIPPSECLVLEDSAEGLIAAKAAGAFPIDVRPLIA